MITAEKKAKLSFFPVSLHLFGIISHTAQFADFVIQPFDQLVILQFDYTANRVKNSRQKLLVTMKITLDLELGVASETILTANRLEVSANWLRFGI